MSLIIYDFTILILLRLIIRTKARWSGIHMEKKGPWNYLASHELSQDKEPWVKTTPKKLTDRLCIPAIIYNERIGCRTFLRHAYIYMFVNILLLEYVLYLIYVLLGITFMLEPYSVLGI